MRTFKPICYFRWLLLLLLAIWLVSAARGHGKPDTGWPSYRNDPLSAGGQATLMTYTLKGRQYLVIAAGGHGKFGTKRVIT